MSASGSHAPSSLPTAQIFGSSAAAAPEPAKQPAPKQRPARGSGGGGGGSAPGADTHHHHQQQQQQQQQQPDLHLGCIRAIYGPAGSEFDDEAIVAIDTGDCRSGFTVLQRSAVIAG